MARKKLSYEFTKGIIKENPVLCLVLGTCPTLAVTTSAINAIGMGIAATIVLTCSNTVISFLRNVIPDKVRIPCYITIIAGFVTIVQMFVKAFTPEINDALGIFLPLIVVNCIILGRAEMYAGKNPILPSILDGLGMGVGFTCAMLSMGIIREILGSGTLFGMTVTANLFEPVIIFILAPGGFFVFGMLIAIANKLSSKDISSKEIGCSSCPLGKSCSKICSEEVVDK
jgi:electron transport complex protein RnfE